MPGTSTTGDPLPRSTIFITFRPVQKDRPYDGTPSLIPQRLSGFQRVLNALPRLAFCDQTEKRLALEVEQVLLADRRCMAKCASSHDRCEPASNQGVVIADSSRAP